MLFRPPEDAFVALLREAYRRSCHGPSRLPRRVGSFGTWSASRPLSSHTPSRPTPEHDHDSSRLPPARRGFATTVPRQAPREIAIIGGGITGLTAAHYLARWGGDIRITLFEGGDRLGGWIDAAKVPVDKGDGEGGSDHVLFQRGPRTLRSAKSALHYDDMVFYDVVASLKLQDKIRHPRSTSNGRYVYYPDHLVQLPGNEMSLSNLATLVKSFITEPIWNGAVKSAMSYASRVAAKESPPEFETLAELENYTRDAMNNNFQYYQLNESVGHFLERLFGDDQLAKNLVSGMMHGIYGGDIYKLDVKRTILAGFWFSSICKLPDEVATPRRADVCLMVDLLNGPNGDEIKRLATEALNWDLITFDDGLLTLVEAMVEDLKSFSNVQIKLNTPITSLQYSDSGGVLVDTKQSVANKEPPAKFEHVISTIFSRHLARLAKPENSLPSLAETHAVTMMVVNLWYPKQDLLKDRHGFGYLIPVTTPDNAEGVLGVLFDSDLRSTEDTTEANGTKLTVMMGGHHWDRWEWVPSEEKAAEMAKSVVQRQLGVSPEAKVYASARLCRDCMPQQFVLHYPRMGKAGLELSRSFNGHLSVAGPSYTDVGVLPSMAAGLRAAMSTLMGEEAPEDAPSRKPTGEVWDGQPRGGERPHWFEKEINRPGPAFHRHTGLGDFTDKVEMPPGPLAEPAVRCVAIKDTMPFRKWSRAPDRPDPRPAVRILTLKLLDERPVHIIK